MSLRYIVEEQENEIFKGMKARHADVGHVLLRYDKKGIKTYECETCLNRMGRKSFRQMTGRRYMEGEVVS